MSADGVLVHQLDGYIFAEGDVAGFVGGRYKGLDYVAGSMIHASQRARFGRLPVYDINGAGRFGGVVIRTSAARVKCMYGADATTWNVPARFGGCASYAGWCDAFAQAPLDAPCAGHTGRSETYACECCTRAQCGGQQLKPWKGEHLASFLQMYSRHGGHGACCGSGYNEVIVVGGEEWNNALPQAIEAFFFEPGFNEAPSTVRRLRNGFLKHWGLAQEDVPLLKFNRGSFDGPFSDASV